MNAALAEKKFNDEMMFIERNETSGKLFIENVNEKAYKMLMKRLIKF